MILCKFTCKHCKLYDDLFIHLFIYLRDLQLNKQHCANIFETEMHQGLSFFNCGQSGIKEKKFFDVFFVWQVISY